MKNKEIKALEKEYNETVEKGRELWDQLIPMANRCNEIIKILRDNKIEFDEIALIFGGELEIETAGKDEDNY
jgi:hypothetical protein